MPLSEASLLATWNWAPSIVVGLAIFIGAYLAAISSLRARFAASTPASRTQIACFTAGALVIWLALVSPLDAIGDGYLFSAHMLQHLLLALVAPPLLLLGTPGWLLRPLLHITAIRRSLRVLTAPPVALILFNATFFIWHVPALYEATLHNEVIHIIEHMLFIATGLLNWWPILSPLPELPRLSAPAQILYLFLAGFPATILGALIVFAAAPLYPTYAAAPRAFALDPIADQQLAGLIMWMPGGMIYLLALSLVFFAWLQREEQRTNARFQSERSRRHL